MRTDEQTYRDRFCWAPNERRRLARNDSAPGRRFARTVHRGRPHAGSAFTRRSVEQMAMTLVRGLRMRHLTIAEDHATASVTISIATPGADLGAFLAWVRAAASPGILVTVEGAKKTETSA